MKRGLPGFAEMPNQQLHSSPIETLIVVRPRRRRPPA